MTTTLLAPAPAAGGTALLSYRPYRGKMRGSALGVAAIARSGLKTVARRKLFWALFALGVLIFLFFFFGQYIAFWLAGNQTEGSIRIGAGSMPIDPSRLLANIRDQLKINGSGEAYMNVIWYEGYLVMIVLALSGAVLVGNDFRFGSLPFYLSKPLGRWHYVLGKCLAVGVIVNVMTTLFALALWVEYGLLDSWSYFADSARLAVGLVGYGLVMTVVLSLLLVTTASWVRRTVPMVMIWTTLFVFARGLGEALVRLYDGETRWRLIDVWGDLYSVGCWFMGLPVNGAYPSSLHAAVVLFFVCAGCLIYLNRRIRAVEIV